MARDYSKWASNRGTWREVLFPETIGRVEYFLRNIALTLLMMIALIPFSVLTSLAGDGGRAAMRPYSTVAGLAVIVVTVVLGIVSIAYPRMRDMGWKPALAWLLLVPYLGILVWAFLVIAPSARPGRI